MTALISARLTSLLLSGPVAGIPGGPELWIILFIVLILFGRRLPGVARSLGQGISSFKKGLSEPVEADDPTSGGEKEDKKALSSKDEASKDDA